MENAAVGAISFYMSNNPIRYHRNENSSLYQFSSLTKISLLCLIIHLEVFLMEIFHLF